MYRDSGRSDLAVVELEQAVLLDPTNDYAATELRKAREDLAKEDGGSQRRVEHRSASRRRRRGARATMRPILEPSSDKPINLNFPQPKPIKQIYRALADAAGINVIFDPQLKDDNVSIVLSNIEFQKALETLLRQENHFYKVIDERTILIAADTPQNRKTYEDLVIRTFFLSNARRHRGRERPAGAPPDDAHLGQQGRELDHAARHRRQGRRGRAHRRAERQAGLRGRRGRRAAPGQHGQDARPRADADPAADQRDRSGARGHDEPRRGAGRGSVHLEPAEAAQHQLLRLHDPLRDADVHQGQHGRRAAREAAAPDRRGAEGAAPDRRQGADPGDDASRRRTSAAATSCP